MIPSTNNTTNEILQTTAVEAPENNERDVLSKFSKIALTSIATLSLTSLYHNDYLRFHINKLGVGCAKALGGCYLLGHGVKQLFGCYNQDEGFSWKKLGLGLLSGALGATALYSAYGDFQTAYNDPDIKNLACADEAPYKDWLPGTCDPLAVENMKVAFKHGGLQYVNQPGQFGNAAIIEPTSDHNGALEMPDPLANMVYQNYRTSGGIVAPGSNLCETLVRAANGAKLDFLHIRAHAAPSGLSFNEDWAGTITALSWGALSCLPTVLKPNARIAMSSCNAGGSSDWRVARIFGNIAQKFANNAPGSTVYASLQAVSVEKTMATLDKKGLVPHFAGENHDDVTTVEGPDASSFVKKENLAFETIKNKLWLLSQAVNQLFTFSGGVNQKLRKPNEH